MPDHSILTEPIARQLLDKFCQAYQYAINFQAEGKQQQRVTFFVSTRPQFFGKNSSETKKSVVSIHINNIAKAERTFIHDFPAKEGEAVIIEQMLIDVFMHGLAAIDKQIVPTIDKQVIPAESKLTRLSNIFKVQLTDKRMQTIHLPKDYKILSFQLQKGVPTIWYMTTQKNVDINRVVALVVTGANEIESEGVKYVGTVQNESSEVLHCFIQE